jgi:hypothetical protein
MMLYVVQYRFWAAQGPQGVVSICTSQTLAEDAVAAIKACWPKHQPDGFEIEEVAANSFTAPGGSLVTLG